MEKIEDCNFFDYIVVGSGFAGTICARKLAEKGKKILVLEKRKHIAGNMYDYYDNNDLLIHKYGPHIIMTDKIETVDYIKQFDDIVDISVKMETSVRGKAVPLPININSIKKMYSKTKAQKIIQLLCDEYGYGNEVNILDLLKNKSVELQNFAQQVYEDVFVGYNVKMWGVDPTKVDRNVVGRVPIRISDEDVRSKYCYNFVPKQGYTKLFENILNHPNITVITDIDATDVITINNNGILVDGKYFNNKVIYTGPLDALFDFKYGKLPYRSVFFKKTIVKENNEFTGLALTYPKKYSKFRTSDMERVTGVGIKGKVAMVSEYAGEYDTQSNKFNVPSYPVINENNLNMLNKYKNLADSIDNFYYIGRLAEFKYYNMSEIIETAFEFVKQIIK